MVKWHKQSPLKVCKPWVDNCFLPYCGFPFKCLPISKSDHIIHRIHCDIPTISHPHRSIQVKWLYLTFTYTLFFSARKSVCSFSSLVKGKWRQCSVFWSWFWYFWAKEVTSIDDHSAGHLPQTILSPLWALILDSVLGRHIGGAGGHLLNRSHGYLDTIGVINNAAIKLNIQRK